MDNKEFISIVIGFNFDEGFAIKELQTMVMDFFDNNSDRLKLDNIPEFAVKRAIELVIEKGIDEDYEVNGWQHDFWYSFSYRGKNYQYSGCGFYCTNDVELLED
jgi:hypothetical protein